MTKAMPSYMYGDPADAIDRIRSSERKKMKKRQNRKNGGLTEEELQCIPEEWLTGRTNHDGKD